MFIPLHDANSLKHIRWQYVTLTIIALNVIVYAFTGLAGETSEFTNAAVLGLGFIPAVVNDFVELAPGFAIIPEPATYVSYAFLHGGLMHLGSNMLFIWVFGDNVEDAMGHIRFLIFYLICAAAGALAHGLLLPQSEAPLIGASGAASGIVAAYLILHPRVRLWILALGRIPLPLPAFIPLALWIIFQFAMVISDPDGEVSWAAHVGGIVAGAILILFLRRRGVPLFDREIVSPLAVEHIEDTANITTNRVDDGSQKQPSGPWGRQE